MHHLGTVGFVLEPILSNAVPVYMLSLGNTNRERDFLFLRP